MRLLKFLLFAIGILTARTAHADAGEFHLQLQTPLSEEPAQVCVVEAVVSDEKLLPHLDGTNHLACNPTTGPQGPPPAHLSKPSAQPSPQLDSFSDSGCVQRKAQAITAVSTFQSTSGHWARSLLSAMPRDKGETLALVCSDVEPSNSDRVVVLRLDTTPTGIRATAVHLRGSSVDVTLEKPLAKPANFTVVAGDYVVNATSPAAKEDAQLTLTPSWLRRTIQFPGDLDAENDFVAICIKDTSICAGTRDKCASVDIPIGARELRLAYGAKEQGCTALASTRGLFETTWSGTRPPDELIFRVSVLSFHWQRDCFYDSQNGKTCPTASVPAAGLRCTSRSEGDDCIYQCSAAVEAPNANARWCDSPSAARPLGATLSPMMALPVEVELHAGRQNDVWRETLQYIGQQIGGFASRDTRQVSIDIPTGVRWVWDSSQTCDCGGATCSGEQMTRLKNECTSICKSSGVDAANAGCLCKQAAPNLERVDVFTGQGSQHGLEILPHQGLNLPGLSCADAVSYRYWDKTNIYDEGVAHVAKGRVQLPDPAKRMKRIYFYVGGGLGYLYNLDTRGRGAYVLEAGFEGRFNPYISLGGGLTYSLSEKTYLVGADDPHDGKRFDFYNRAIGDLVVGIHPWSPFAITVGVGPGIGWLVDSNDRTTLGVYEAYFSGSLGLEARPLRRFAMALTSYLIGPEAVHGLSADGNTVVSIHHRVNLMMVLGPRIFVYP